MTTTPTKARIKARRMWSASIKQGAVMHESRRPIIGFIPVAVLDCSDEEALIKQVARVIANRENHRKVLSYHQQEAIAILTDLGIIRRRANR